MNSFGRLPDGRPAKLFTLAHPGGFRADISDYGGTIVRLFAPDRRGALADVVHGFDSVEPYLTHASYFGALIGRFGNRIGGGTFTLDGVTYRLPTNNTPGGLPCHLHGGKGFDQVLWAAEEFSTPEGPALRLRHRSPDGDQGYPGNLDVTVTYTLAGGSTLRIEYLATTDRATPVNLTNHAYFNLAGHDRGDILGHELTLRASHFTPTNAGLIPTGEIASVAGTPFDFRTPRAIGARIGEQHPDLQHGGGYDHNWVLDSRSAGVPPASAEKAGKDAGATPTLAATVREPSSGRILEVLTTEPGVQFYSGNFLDGTLTGKGGHRYARRSAFCLETQHFPDSPNQPAFPSTILRPGETYRTSTEYRFSAH